MAARVVGYKIVKKGFNSDLKFTDDVLRRINQQIREVYSIYNWRKIPCEQNSLIGLA